MWTGDKAYSDLMRELWGSPGIWNEKKKFVEIARKLVVDEETVRNRIKYLKESGFLIGWRVVPNPALLNRRPATLLIETKEQEESKEEIISRLKGKDGVISVVSIYGNDLLVNLFDDEVNMSSKLISKLPGIRISPLSIAAMSLPTSSFRMTTTDWKIVSILLRDAEIKVTVVAKGIKSSPKTIKRRLNLMMSASAILIMPMVDLKKASGIPYSLMIQCQEGKKEEVDRAVADRIDNLVFRATASKDGLIFGFTGSNIMEGNELLKWVRRLDGVKAVRMNITEEVFHFFDWLQREVDRRALLTAPK